MNQVNSNVLLVRALKTFVQAALAFAAAGVLGVTNSTAMKSLAVGAIAAGISAVMNLFVQPQEAK